MPNQRAVPPDPSSARPGPDTLRPFFDPAGVAVIGASSNPRKLSHGVLRNLMNNGYGGAIYPVNPGSERILGLPCYPDIAGAPDPLDLAVIILPAALCPPVLEACGRRGIKAAIILSGGFKEVGPAGAVLEAELVRISRAYGIRLIGPNCVGVMDANNGLNTTFVRTMPKPGHIGFISQSGAICAGILEWTDGKGVGFSRFATVGNEADVNESDLIEVMAEDPNTRVIVLYIEGIQDGRRFIEVAGRVTPHKPILAIKAGATEAGTRAVSSHTGSLAGQMAAYDAAFRQSGVIRVDSVERLFNDALALAYGPLPRGPRVAIVTNAGGPASLAADEIERQGLQMPVPGPATLAELARHNHPDAQLHNPVDMLGGAEAANFESATRLLLADDGFDALLAILVPQALVDPVAVAEAICMAAAERDKPVVACFMGDAVVRKPLAVFHRHQIAAYQFPEQAAQALGTLWRYVEGRRAEVGGRRSEARGRRAEGGEALDGVLAGGRREVGEWAGRPLLARYGIPQPEAGLARSGEDAARLAADLGFPVVLKVVSPDIFHKSEAGGVLLNLHNQDEVRRGYETLLARLARRLPSARIEGVLVAQMARPGHELIVGMRRDPQFGPLLMVGLGGIYVELFKDVAFRVAPFDRSETLRMIDETRAGKLLRGLRGQPPADVAAVAEIIERVAQLALDAPRIEEIDINPLIVDEQGALAVDVRLVLAAGESD